MSERLIHSVDELPERYALRATGKCLAPVFADGDLLPFSKTEPVRPGDFCALFMRPELVRPGAPQAFLKRMFMAPGVSLPYNPHPDSDVVPIVIVEQLSPPRQMETDCAKLLAIHKCLGRVAADVTVVMEENAA